MGAGRSEWEIVGMNDLIARLEAIDREAREISHQIGRMVPERPALYDLHLEAYTRSGAIGAEAVRAIRALRRAIRKELGE